MIDADGMPAVNTNLPMPNMKPPKEAYTLDVIRQAFWNTFHESGDVWFSDLGSQDENEQSTTSVWDEFLTELHNVINNKGGV